MKHPRWRTPIRAMLSLLHHSWRHIEFSYDGLTATEKECLTRSEHLSILEEMSCRNFEEVTDQVIEQAEAICHNEVLAAWQAEHGRQAETTFSVGDVVRHKVTGTVATINGIRPGAVSVDAYLDDMWWPLHRIEKVCASER